MDVHSRSANHPLLGRVRIGASRVRPLSPELHTADYSSACPGSSTWMDKVPSRDTPSLNLADCRGGVDPDSPQVTRDLSNHPTGTAPPPLAPADGSGERPSTIPTGIRRWTHPAMPCVSVSAAQSFGIMCDNYNEERSRSEEYQETLIARAWFSVCIPGTGYIRYHRSKGRSIGNGRASVDLPGTG